VGGEFPARSFRMDGDPGTIRESAGRWSSFGTAATDAGGQITAIDTGRGWSFVPLGLLDGDDTETVLLRFEFAEQIDFAWDGVYLVEQTTGATTWEYTPGTFAALG
jgi:hypothetical protein